MHIPHAQMLLYLWIIQSMLYTPQFNNLELVLYKSMKSHIPFTAGKIFNESCPSHFPSNFNIDRHQL